MISDARHRRRSRARRATVPGLLLASLTLIPLVACGDGAPAAAREVVIYTSLDQRLSEPVLAAYEEETGVRVKILYDTEATKTTGLVNRLLAEKRSPQADVFWNSEIVRTVVLKRAGVLEPYHSPAAAEIPATFKDAEAYWTGFAGRVRVLGVNTDLLPEERWPRSFDDLAEPEWNDRFAIAYPLFGTTSFHAAALFALTGEEAARERLTKLANNGARVVNGNSTARDLLVAGEVPVCFTDSDDIAVALERGEPVGMVVPRVTENGVLLIPNSVALIAGGPNPDEGRALIDYLLSPDVERALAEAAGAQIPLRPGAAWPEPVPRFDLDEASDLDYEAIAGHLEEAMAFCEGLFLR